MHIITLSNGKVLPAVEVDKVLVVPHSRIGFDSGKYYVRIQMRNGAVEDVIERVSDREATKKQQEILVEVKQGWAERDPYDAGISEGRQTGFSAGRTEGYEQGREDGLRIASMEAARSERSRIRSALIERQFSYRKELNQSNLYRRSDGI